MDFMDLRSILITDSVSVAILIILHYVARARVIRDRTEDRIYTVMVFGVMLGSIMEAFSFVLDGRVFPGARVLNYLINTYIFSANMLLPFFLLVYVDLCLYGRLDRIWKRYKPQIIIGIVMVAANVVNYFVPISYYITEGNVYERRPFSYAYYVVIIYYFVTTFFLLRRFRRENDARSFLRFGLFIVPVILGTGLQFLFYGLSLAWLSSAVGLVGLFMMQQNEMAYIDPLVGIYNRQYMDHILASWINRDRSFVGAMLDIDRFKSINDTYGHTEGDKALKTLSNILKESCSGGEWLFRFAGDEFIVLKQSEVPSGLDGFLEEVERRLAEVNQGKHPYQLSVSYGVDFSLRAALTLF